MSQGSIQPSGNQSGSGFSAAVRTALDIVASFFAGASAPAATGQPFGHQLWIDTTASRWKKRNGGNTVWLSWAESDAMLHDALSKNVVVQVPEGTVTTAVVTADLLSVEGVYCKSVSATMSTGTSAGSANALDSGAWATSTWYSVWVIASDDGSLVAALASTSATSPTLPSGYTRKRRVGWVRSTSGTATNLTPQRGLNGRVFYDGDLADNGALTSTTFANVDVSSRVPPNVTRAFLNAYAAKLDAVANYGEVYVRDGSSSASTGRRLVRTAQANGAWGTNDVEVGLNASRVFQYRVGAANQEFWYAVTGYHDVVC